jgi:hypothetical protein
MKTAAVLTTLALIALSGCVTVTNEKTLVIPPSDKPVSVTATSVTTCYKNPWLHCSSHQKLEASNGQVVSDFPEDSK